MKPKAPQTLVQTAELAVERAKKAGAGDCSSKVHRRRNYKVVCRDGKWEELSSSTQCSLSVRLFVEGRYAVHSTTDISPNGVESFITEAVTLTRHLMEDKYRKLPPPELYEGRSKKDLGLYDPKYRNLDLAARQAAAVKVYEEAKRSAGEKLISASASFSDTVVESVVRHTNGFAENESETFFSAGASVSLQDSGGSRPSDWAAVAARFLDDLAEPQKAGKEAAQRARAQLGAKKIESVKLPIIVENRAVPRLLGGLLQPLYGSALYQGRSCFEKSLNQTIAAPVFSIIDSPLHEKGFSSRRYDGEGITARKLPIIENGILKSFYLDTYYAGKLEKDPTTGSQSNLVFSQGKKDLKGLCKEAGKALLITRFIGGNSNPTTGDFSHGVAGFLVENGEIGQPVIELNISGNHTNQWKGLVGIGSDPFPYSSVLSPSLLFAETTIAGK